jgi:hypothetical protein
VLGPGREYLPAKKGAYPVGYRGPSYPLLELAAPASTAATIARGEEWLMTGIKWCDYVGRLWIAFSTMLQHEAAGRALNLRQTSTQSNLASPRKQGNESCRQFFASVGAGNAALTIIAVGAWHLFGASRSATIIATGEVGQRPINAGF